MGLLLLAIKGGGDEHADPHEPGVLHFQPDLRGADSGVEDGPDVADTALKHPAGIGVEADVRIVAQADEGEIVLVHVADDPDSGRGWQW